MLLRAAPGHRSGLQQIEGLSKWFLHGRASRFSPRSEVFFHPSAGSTDDGGLQYTLSIWKDWCLRERSKLSLEKIFQIILWIFFITNPLVKNINYIRHPPAGQPFEPHLRELFKVTFCSSPFAIGNIANTCIHLFLAKRECSSRMSFTILLHWHLLMKILS